MPSPIKIILSGIDNFSRVMSGVTSKVDGFGKRMKGVGKQLSIGLSIPMALFGKAAVDAAATYEQSMARVQVLTGATALEMEQLRKLTEKIGTTTRFSSIEAIQAFEKMTDAGFNLTQGMTALPGVMQMAKIGMMEIGDAVGVTDTIMEAYGKRAEDIAKVNDVLATAAPTAGTGFKNLARSLETLSPLAQQLGIPLEDMTSVLALAGSSGLNMTRATRGLGMAFTGLMEPSAKAIKTFTNLGIAQSDIFNKDGSMRSIAEVFDVFRKKGATASDMMDIFGRTSGPIMATLLGRGSGALKDIRDGLTGTTGTADKLSNQMGETFTEKMGKFNASLTTLKQTIGNEILPILIPFGQALVDLMGAFSALPKPVKIALSVLGLLAAIIPPLLIGLASMSLAFVILSGTIMSIPVFGWIIAGITAAIAGIVLLVKHWDSVVEAIKRVGRAIKSWIPEGVLNFMGMGSGPAPTAAPAPAAPAAGLRDRMAAAASSSSTTSLIIDNKNGSVIRAKTEGADLNMQTYFGAALPAFP